jgi:hypothetical protein
MFGEAMGHFIAHGRASSTSRALALVIIAMGEVAFDGILCLLD